MKQLKLSALAIFVIFGVPSAHAGEYVCKVYCDSGSTNAVVQASSASDAAKKIDPTPVANRICQDAGKGNASSSTMSGGQCSTR